MSGRLDGSVVLVTGGSRGIGRAIVEVALAEGAQVAFFDVLAEPGARTAAESGATFHRVDVTDEASVIDGITAVRARHGHIDVAINNAGKNAYFDPETMTVKQWDETFAVDLKGAWLVSKHLIGEMKSRRSGSIVNVASIHATMTSAGYFPYAAAKSGLIGMTKSMALDLGPYGIRVNAVSPGFTRTFLVDEWLSSQPESTEDAVIAAHPMHTIGEPVDIAEVVCFLASDAARFVTGADWAVDGGLSARYASP